MNQLTRLRALELRPDTAERPSQLIAATPNRLYVAAGCALFEYDPELRITDRREFSSTIDGVLCDLQRLVVVCGPQVWSRAHGANDFVAACDDAWGGEVDTFCLTGGVLWYVASGPVPCLVGLDLTSARRVRRVALGPDWGGGAFHVAANEDVLAVSAPLDAKLALISRDAPGPLELSDNEGPYILGFVHRSLICWGNDVVARNSTNGAVERRWSIHAPNSMAVRDGVVFIGGPDGLYSLKWPRVESSEIECLLPSPVLHLALLGEMVVIARNELGVYSVQ